MRDKNATKSPNAESLCPQNLGLCAFRTIDDYKTKCFSKMASRSTLRSTTIPKENVYQRHEVASKFKAVAVQPRDIKGPPPEHVPRNVIETGFMIYV